MTRPSNRRRPVQPRLTGIDDGRHSSGTHIVGGRGGSATPRTAAALGFGVAVLIVTGTLAGEPAVAADGCLPQQSFVEACAPTDDGGATDASPADLPPAAFDTPTDVAAPAAPAAPAGPEPEAPPAPAAPAEPEAPAEPASPAAFGEPAAPAEPAAPDEPDEPAGPAGPGGTGRTC